MGNDEGLKPSQKAVEGGKQVFAAMSAKQLGQQAGLGREEVAPVIDLAKQAAKTNTTAFLSGAAETHWSNPDGPTGGMPPEDKSANIGQ